MHRLWRTLLAVCLLWPLTTPAEVKIAINSPRGELVTLKKWRELGPYLEQQLGDKVSITPFSVTEIIGAAAKGEFDFVFANPMQTLVIREKHAYVPMLTLAKKNGPRFAGVIITRPGSGIETAADLRGKKVIALSPNAAGAHIFQVYHLHQNGIDAYQDLAALREAKRLDDIVLAVKAGLFDAGFIRTGVLESMHKEGKIKMADLTVVDKRENTDFKLLHSTILYPEWFFCAKTGIDADLQARMKKALLAVTAESEVADTAGIKGFVEALSLDNLLQAVKTLKIPPFDGS